MAQIIFLHGPAASGKLTIAQELSAITGLPLFHNHLTVDLLLSLFPFGSPPFIYHRERIWLELTESAIAAGTSFIFTFNPERTVSADFPSTLRERAEKYSGLVSFIEITCPEEVIESRIEAKSRQDFRKLRSLPLYRQLKRDGAFAYPQIKSELTIDSSADSPQQAARKIATACGLDCLPS